MCHLKHGVKSSVTKKCQPQLKHCWYSPELGSYLRVLKTHISLFKELLNDCQLSVWLELRSARQPSISLLFLQSWMNSHLLHCWSSALSLWAKSKLKAKINFTAQSAISRTRLSYFSSSSKLLSCLVRLAIAGFHACSLEYRHPCFGNSSTLARPSSIYWRSAYKLEPQRVSSLNFQWSRWPFKKLPEAGFLSYWVKERLTTVQVRLCPRMQHTPFGASYTAPCNSLGTEDTWEFLMSLATNTKTSIFFYSFISHS